MAKKHEEGATDLMVSQTTALSTEVADFGEYAGAGYEDVSAADMKIPLLKILQSTSPQVKVKGEGYVDGAKESMIFLSIPETLWDGDAGAVFVPAAIQHVFLEQVPYGEGGGKGKGFRGIKQQTDPDVIRARSAWLNSPEGKLKPLANYPTGRGTEFVETYQVFGVATKDNELIGPFSYGVKGKAIKHFRTWLTTINQYRHRTAQGLQEVPLFAHLTRLTTQYEQNESGEFYTPKLTPANNRAVKDSLLNTSSELFLQAKGLHSIIRTGKVDTSSYNDVDVLDPVVGDDVPF